MSQDWQLDAAESEHRECEERLEQQEILKLQKDGLSLTEAQRRLDEIDAEQAEMERLEGAFPD